jgi:phosphoribosylaminoimidazole (AIR) synthetase
MARVFNLGIGMVVAVRPGDVARTLDVLQGAGHAAVEIGRLVRADGDGRKVNFV